jgi:VWFA-related protein
VVDDIHMEFESLARFQKAVGRFVEQDLQPEDQVALVTTSGASALSQEFTSDREALRRTVARLSAQGRNAAYLGIPNLTEYQADLIEQGDPAAIDVAVEEIINAGISFDRQTAETIARTKARGMLNEAMANSRLTLEALERLCRGLGGLSGRKMVVLVSDGFLVSLVSQQGLAFDVRRVADAGTRAGVTVYSLDTRGLVGIAPSSRASSAARIAPQSVGQAAAINHRSLEVTRDALNALAVDTGGFMIHDSNNLRAGLQKMMKATESYYVLAYESSNPKRDGAFRKIEVKLNGVKGAKVRTRSGYFAPDDRGAIAEATPEMQARRREQRFSEMRTALHSLAPLSGVPLRVSADYVSGEGGQGQVVVSGHIDTVKLPFVKAQGRYQATVEAVAAVFDESGGTVVTLPTERMTMDLGPTDYEQVLKRGLPYQKTANLKPGKYQVRLAAREDASGLLGSVWQDIEVPDLTPGRLTLSGLFLLKDNDARAAGQPAEAGANLQNVQALRRYQRADSLYAHFIAYNGKRDASGAADLVSQAEILRGGKVLGKAAPEPLAVGAPNEAPRPHTTRIKLQPLDPGSYELRVTVIDRIANTTASQQIGFTVD